MKTVTLPLELFEELCAEAEHHAAERAATALGPHRAFTAEAARDYVAGRRVMKLAIRSRGTRGARCS